MKKKSKPKIPFLPKKVFGNTPKLDAFMFHLFDNHSCCNIYLNAFLYSLVCVCMRYLMLGKLMGMHIIRCLNAFILYLLMDKNHYGQCYELCNVVLFNYISYFA